FASSRWWVLKKIGNLLVSGTKPVEFTDFWLGDQFCSLIYTFSNLYFVGCAYQQKWNNAMVNCSTSKHWGLPFVLASLPLAVRAVQCVKRYSDVARTNGDQHSAGKYTTSIVYYAFYYNWRHHNLAHDYSFATFIMFATCYSIYTCSWDIFIDWSLLKHDRQHIFLRDNLLYSQKSVYYFAIISNIILRFSWVIYIPGGNFNFNLRSFVAGFLEMFRRWQWNFYRLEAEQLGNIDMYAAVRDVRLPYDAAVADDDDDDDYELHSRDSWGSKSRRAQMLRPSQIKLDDHP
ncbi:EXS-domain-containing protein, partial [Schizopora paradoxa]